LTTTKTRQQQKHDNNKNKNLNLYFKKHLKQFRSMFQTRKKTGKRKRRKGKLMKEETPVFSIQMRPKVELRLQNCRFYSRAEIRAKSVARNSAPGYTLHYTVNAEGRPLRTANVACQPLITSAWLALWS